MPAQDSLIPTARIQERDAPKSKVKTLALVVVGMLAVASAGAWFATTLKKAPTNKSNATETTAAEPIVDDGSTVRSNEGTQIRLAAEDGLVQWFRITDADSGEQHKGRGELEITLPPGPHDLAIKRVGQSVMEAEFTVGDTDAEYLCAKNDDEIFECTAEDLPPIAFATE